MLFSLYATTHVTSKWTGNGYRAIGPEARSAQEREHICCNNEVNILTKLATRLPVLGSDPQGLGDIMRWTNAHTCPKMGPTLPSHGTFPWHAMDVVGAHVWRLASM